MKIVKRGKRNFSLLRFSGIGCGKGRLSCGVIQKGPFCPCGEWRGDSLLSSRSELRFDRTVLSPVATNTAIFFKKLQFFRKRNVSLIPFHDILIDIIQEKNKLETSSPQKIVRDSFELSEVLNPLISQENLDNYDNRLINICQIPHIVFCATDSCRLKGDIMIFFYSYGIMLRGVKNNVF